MMNTTVKFSDDAEVCSLGQGTWYMGEKQENRKEEIKTLQTGIEMGLSAIDTAEMYGDGRSEKLVAEAIEGRRDKVFLISKVLPSHAGYNGTLEACERSLKRLGTDYLDLYLLHWRGKYPLEETVQAMNELQQQGKINRWGVSNFDVDDMDELYQKENGNLCAANEVLYNLSRRGIEYDLLPWCLENNIPVIAYSPIEQGKILNNKTITDISRKHEATPAQIALAWVLTNKSVLAIPKAGTVKHVEDNFNSLSIELDEDDFRLLDKEFPAPKKKVALETL